METSPNITRTHDFLATEKESSKNIINNKKFTKDFSILAMLVIFSFIIPACSSTGGSETTGDDNSQSISPGYINSSDKEIKDNSALLPPNFVQIKGGTFTMGSSDSYGDYEVADQTNPDGAVSGSYRVVRGGSWYSFGNSFRSAYRYYDDPPDQNNGIGFRLVRP